MDENFADLAKWIRASGFKSAVVPARMMAEVSAACDLDDVRSYVTVPGGLSEIDAVIMHKGLLDRIDPEVILECFVQWPLSFANDVYCGFARNGGPGLSHDERSRHIGPVAQWLGDLHRASQPIGGGALNSALIVSAYGVGNIGDDLVTVASEHMLRDAGISEVTFAGPTAKPEDILSHDVIALGGGGIIYDTSAENLENYLFPLRLAARLGKATAVLGVGTQGLFTQPGREATANTLMQTGMVSVRSEQDVDILAEIDPLLADHVMAGVDLGFYMAPLFRQRAVTAGQGVPTILVSLASTTTDPSLGEIPMPTIMEDVVAALVRKREHVVLGLQSEDDRPMYEAVARAHPGVALIDLSALGPMAAASIFSSVDKVITSRFHGLIYASIFGKPLVTIHRGECKTHRLVNGYLPSLKDQLITARGLNGNVILERFEIAAAPDRAEVDNCISRARGIAQALKSYLNSQGQSA